MHQRVVDWRMTAAVDFWTLGYGIQNYLFVDPVMWRVFMQDRREIDISKMAGVFIRGLPDGEVITAYCPSTTLELPDAESDLVCLRWGAPILLHTPQFISDPEGWAGPETEAREAARRLASKFQAWGFHDAMLKRGTLPRL